MHTNVKYNPLLTAPDKDPKMVAVNEMIDSLNMRAVAANPNGGSGVYKIAGNTIITNALLPAGTNKAIGWCVDKAGRRLIWANWNTTDSLQTIFCYSVALGFQIILQQDLGWSVTSEVSMDFGNEILIWTSIDVEDPREINVTRALAGGYTTPLEDWQLAQLHRPPAYPPQLFANTPPEESRVFDIAIQQPKPFPDTVLQGYLFSYNYEYLDNIEGRRSQPSFVTWNNGPWLIVPDEEFNGYLKVDAATPNPSIVAVRFYYQIGTDGAIHYFKRVKNEVANWLSSPATDPALPGQHFGFRLPDLVELYDIGSPSASALLASDGIERYIQDNIFADNRNVLANMLGGYDFEFPTLPAVSIETDYFDVTSQIRNFTIFPPMSYQVPLALLFEDKYGRAIATQTLGNYTINRPSNYYFPMVDYGGDPDDQWWNTIIDSNGPFGYPAPYNLPSTSDMVDSGYIKITPPVQVLPADVFAVKLITRPKIKITGFIRSLCNPYFIYGSPDIGFKLFWNNDNTSNAIDGVSYNFYGYGFQFRSGEPINFSTEQNYYIQVRGQTGPEIPTGDFTFNMIPGWTARDSVFSDDFEFKITDQLGDILISAQPYTAPPNPGSGAYSLLAAIGDFENPGVNGDETGYYHSILDVVLYSRVQEQTAQWVQVPNVWWTAAQYAAGTVDYYFGDSYFTADQKRANATLKAAVYWGSGSVVETFTDYNLGQMTWPGYFCSPNLNGIFLETWDSPFGAVSVLNEEPQESRLSGTIRHSGAFIPGSKINNNFTFNPLDERTLPYNVGEIVKMLLLTVNSGQGNNVYVFCRNGVMMLFLGKTQQTATDGNAVMSLATQVFGSENVLRFDFGIQHKFQVVATNKGLAFAFDPIQNVYFQLSGNGLDPISEQRNFVKDALTFGDDTIVGYDPTYFEAVGSEDDNGLAYNFKLDTYQGRRYYEGTELFAWLSESQSKSTMFGFFGGNLYKFNTGTSINGQSFQMMAKFVVNIEPEMNKEMMFVGYSGTAGQKSLITNDSGQESTIEVIDFQDSNGVYNGSVKRDENSTGGIMDGTPMEDVIHYVTLQDEDSTPRSIVSVNISFLLSQANIK